MARQPSPERLEELETYLGFYLAWSAYRDVLYPGMFGPGTARERAEARVRALREGLADGSAPFSAVLTGLKQGISDELEGSRDFSPDEVKLADAFLVALKAPSLSRMRERVWRVVPRVLERGRIRTIAEYHVVKNVLDDAPDSLAKGEAERLGALRFEYETRTVKTRRRR